MAATDPFHLVGQTIAGKYRLDRVIGEGGFGVVYGGMHLSLGEPIALKCLKPDVIGPARADGASGEGFLREARVLFSLTHPAIVRMYDVGSVSTASGEVPYVVLELVVGVSLEQEIARRRAECLPAFSAAEVLAIFEPVLDGLAFAHKKGIAHRDLKPSNVMLVAGENGGMSAKLLDFGTARTTGSKLTQMAATAGTGFTPRYAAPEQWDPSYGTTGPGSDIFSLGLILAEVCTLLPMLAGETATEILTQVMSTHRFVTVSASRYDLPPEIDRIVGRATRVALPERFASVREMGDALNETLSRVPSYQAVPLPIAPPLPPHQRTGSPMVSMTGPRYNAFAPTFAATTAHPMSRTLPRPSGTSAVVVVLAVIGGLALVVLLLIVGLVALVGDDADDAAAGGHVVEPVAVPAPAAQGHVSTARIDPLPGWTPAELRAGAEGTFDEVGHCYTTVLAEEPRASGDVELLVEVEPSGGVAGVTLVRSDIKSTKFQECVLGVAGTWDFPDRSNEVRGAGKFKYVLKLRS